MVEKSKINPIIPAGLVALVVGGLIALVAGLDFDAAPERSSEPLANSETLQETTVRRYQDGTYTADGQYFSPGGQERIGVTVTLKNGIITDTSLTKHADSGEGKQYQEQFASGYKSQIVGKQIDKVELSRVAGSSLTSSGFNDALEQIKDDARA